MNAIEAYRALETRSDIHLEDYLGILSQVAKPRVSQFDDKTWACTAIMSVNVAGTLYEIKSDLNCKTPMDAAKQCLERVVVALSKF